MADVKFNCPHCDQKICCDELWGGQQLACPCCQENVTVPLGQTAPPPPAVAAAPAKLSLGRPPTQHAASPEPPPARTGPVYRTYVPPQEKKSGVMTFVKVAVVLVVLGVGGYFGFGLLTQYQEKMNAKRREVEKNSDGGELGHIASVYDALDRTDPDRYEKSAGRSREGVPRPPRSANGKTMRAEADEADDRAVNSTDKDLPVLPAVWTLELEAAKIPQGKANGTIAGTNFIVQTARLDMVGTAPILRLTQGTVVSPDRELIIYLHPKPGEKISGYSLSVTKDMKGATVPQIAKRWKTNPKFAPTQKNFPAGYAMKLELGQISDGTIPGKIFLALPDTEQTVVAGIFRAATGLLDSGAPAAAPPTAPPRAPVAGQVRPEDRYGVSGGLP